MGRSCTSAVLAEAREQVAARRVERTRVEMMRGYAETTTCRRASQDEFPTQAEVAHDQWGTGIVMHNEEDRLTVFFPDHGFRTLSRDVIEEKGLLEAGSSADGG